MPQRVFVDSCIFFSKITRDWLFFLARENAGMFRVVTSHDVLNEALARLRDKYPYAEGELTTKWREQMEACCAEVVQTFPGDAAFTGTDPGDYHVYAATLAGEAAYLLTDNSRADITANPDQEPFDITTADEFFVLVAQSNPACLRPIIKAQLAYWQHNPNQLQLDEALRKADCPEFGEIVHQELKMMAAARDH